MQHLMIHRAPAPFTGLLIPIHTGPQAVPAASAVDEQHSQVVRTEQAEARAEAIATRDAHRKASELVTSAEGRASMQRCPKFNSCGAPICPLDPHWSRRDMLNGEAACTWALEMAKGGPESHYVPEAIRSDIAAVLPVILPSHGMAPLRMAMKAAAKTGSRRERSRFAHLHPVKTETEPTPTH